VDGGSLLLKGFGLGVGYDFFEKVNTTLFYAQNQIEGEAERYSALGSYHATHRAQIYGLRADIYPFTSFAAGGFYFSVAAANVKLESTVDPIFSDDVRVLNTSKTGYQTMAGYEFKKGIFRKISSAINIGLGYGIGGAYENNLGGTQNDVRNSVLVDAGYSYLF
jgi:hypothetical protein